VRAVVQRVSSACVRVGDDVVGAIGPGLCVLVGVAAADEEAEADRMAERLWRLRIFEDDAGKMNRCAAELGVPLLVVSQFTLCADTRRGRRPSFVDAAAPERAEPLMQRLVDRLRALGATVACGSFGADMALTLTNDGPVTLVLDT
jgi:D-tyrosyl-tRNA(Tyr) deacylase